MKKKLAVLTAAVIGLTSISGCVQKNPAELSSTASAVNGQMTEGSSVQDQSDMGSSSRKAGASSSQNSSSNSSSAAVGGRDMTVKVGEVFDTGKYKEQMKQAQQIISSASYHYDASTLEEVYKNSTQLVRCRVEKAEYIAISGQPYTKLDVKILTSFKGNLKPEDQISVLLFGGYLTQQEYMVTRELEDRFANTTKAQRENTILEIKDGDAKDEQYPKAGEEYMMGLLEQTLIKGTYAATTGYYTVYKLGDNGKYTRFPDGKKKNGKTDAGNSKESFTLDWFANKIKKMK